MNLLDDEVLGCEGGILSDDFFDESLKELLGYEKRALFIDPHEVMSESIDAGKEPVEVSGVALFDFAEGELTMGYKNFQEPRYKIFNDMKPAREVMSWVESYYDGDSKDFCPSVMHPMIPHNRYEKFFEFGEMDQIMISRGFRILNPTIQQQASYPNLCDEVPRESSFFLLGRKMTKKQEDSLLEQAKMLVKKSCCVSFQKRQDYYEIVSKDKEEAQVNIARMKELGFCYVDMEVRRKRYLATSKYFTRYYYESYNNVASLVVGFDFNPYSPYAAEELVRVEHTPEGVKYVRRWKDDTIDGLWRYSYKRYHSDAWYVDIFSDSRPYNRALMSLDLVVNSYKMVERFMFYKKIKMGLLTVPLLVDPFVVRQQYYKVLNEGTVRAPIHYRIHNSLDQNMTRSMMTFVPYMTTPCKYRATTEIRDDVISTPMGVQFVSTTISVEVVNKIVILEHGKSQEVLPQDFFSFVRKRISMYNQGFLDQEEYEFFVSQAQMYFVQKQFYVDGKIKKRTKGMKKILVPRYKIYHRIGRDHPGARFYEFVPYAIHRYPCNRWGSLVSSFSVFTLEEFVLNFSKFRDIVRDPPWLFKLENTSLGEIEFDLEAANNCCFESDDKEDL